MATFVLDPAIHTTASVPRVSNNRQRRQYRDKQFRGGEPEWNKKLETSASIYVGNLSCYTNEYQLYELFSRCGSVKRIIMGLDKKKLKPCGFCFVEFDERESALRSIQYLNKTHLDGREIQVDIDAGFEEGRQYGRGVHGGQVGDERRRERDQGGSYQGPRGSLGGVPGAPILTRSITVMACIAMISMLFILTQPAPVGSVDIVIRPFAHLIQEKHTNKASQFVNPIYIRKAQEGPEREQFEKQFAQFLITIMRASKPTLLKAFIKATLDDKKLREIAIGLFFNTTSTDSSDDDDKEDS